MNLMAKLKTRLHKDPQRDARELAKVQAQQQALRELKRNDMRGAPDEHGGAGPGFS